MGTSGWGVGGGVYLGDVVLGLLQLVGLVGPEQLGLRLALLLQHGLGVLPALPRLHTVIEGPLRRTGGRRYYPGKTFSLWCVPFNLYDYHTECLVLS